MGGGHSGQWQCSRQQSCFWPQPSASWLPLILVTSVRPFQEERRSLTMSLGQMDPALVCSGPMSNLSYDSHIVTRCIARLYRKFFLCNRKTFLLWQATNGGRAASTAAGHGPGQLHGSTDGPRDTESGSGALQSLLRSEY